MTSEYGEMTSRSVLSKTDGRCAYCERELDPSAYGKSPKLGAWEINRWVPKKSSENEPEANAFDNLWPACTTCDAEKGDKTGEVYIVRRKADGRPINRSGVVMKHFTERTTPKPNRRPV